MSEEVIANEGAQAAPSETPQVSPEDQAAIDRYRESQMTEEERAERDSQMPEGYNEDGTPQEELIAGKFKSQEDLLKAYEELQKKLGGQSTESEPAAEDAPAETTESEQAVAQEATPVAKYENEFAQNGSLSEASYSELEKMGFTKSQVDQYIAGQQHYADRLRSQIYETAGGEDAYANVIQWASQNMDQSVIADYNNAVDSLDQARIIRNLEYMKLKMETAQPSQARRLEGDSPSQGIQPYRDKNEWQREMTNRLYGKDKKYTNMVDQRYLAARKKGIL